MSDSTNSETQSEQARVWLRPEQVDAMRDAATDTGAKYLRARNEAIVTLLADTGLRNEELTQLTTDMYLRDANELYLPEHVQKQSGNGRDDWPRSSTDRCIDELKRELAVRNYSGRTGSSHS